MATRKTALSVVKTADKTEVTPKPAAAKTAPKTAPKAAAPAVKTAKAAPAKKTAAPKVVEPPKVVETKVVEPKAVAPKVVKPKAVKPQALATVPVGAAGVFLAAKMVETGHTEQTLAKALGVLPRRIHALLGGERRLTADSALRLAAHFGDDPLGWMRFQVEAELAEARAQLAKELAEIKPFVRVEVAQ